MSNGRLAVHMLATMLKLSMNDRQTTSSLPPHSVFVRFMSPPSTAGRSMSLMSSKE